MTKLGKILIILAIVMIAFYFVYIFSINQRENKQINDYIKITSVDEEKTTTSEEIKEEKKEEAKQTINYTAVLEIPSIKLKEGVVNSTKNFKSINYAISVDKNSSYPDKMGNFILYAHSGNSRIAFFKHLNKVNLNDDIYVYFNGTKYQYKIFDKYDIEKSGKAKVISSDSYRYITLITCNQEKKNHQIVLVGKLVEINNY